MIIGLDMFVFARAAVGDFVNFTLASTKPADIGF